MNTSARTKLDVRVEQWPLRVPFRITGSVMTSLDVIVVTLSRAGVQGRGEAAGVDYRGEDMPTLRRQIETVRGAIEAGADRARLQDLLPAGGARNALDCALWELQARDSGLPVWQLAGLDPPRPLLTTWTLGAEDPQTMAAAATTGGFRSARALKLKLTGVDLDAQRVRAVRAARPDVWMGVDANQGFTMAHLRELLPVLQEARVQLIEQPFPVGTEPTLAELGVAIPVAADESLQTLADLPKLAGRFNVVNIKLDKCGGLTEGLQIARRAREQGLGVMVGNMVGTSLAMAPAWVVGQLCQVVDLDGPVLLKEDREPGAVYADGCITCGDQVWGPMTPVRT